MQLWQRLEKLITIAANKYYYACSINGVARFDKDDLIQEAYFAMIKAIEHYDPNENYSFITYFYYPLKNAFADVAGYRKPKQRNDGIKHAFSANVPLTDESDESFLDMIPSDESVMDEAIETVYNQQLHNALEKALSTLSENQEKILRGIFYDNISVKKLAEDTGCTEQNISNEKIKALEKLYHERKENDLNTFLEENTNYYQKMSLKEFKSSGISVVEKIIFKREELTVKWLKKHYNISVQKKGDIHEKSNKKRTN